MADKADELKESAVEKATTGADEVKEGATDNVKSKLTKK